MSERPGRRFAPRLAATRDPAREAAADRVAAGEPLRGEVSAIRAPSALGLGPGQAMPGIERGYFESRLGTDLSGVRVHPDSPVAADYGARGLAAGRDIAIAPGYWQPGTAGFRRLLGHELAHTVQQSRTGPAVQLDGADPPLQEAKKQDETGAAGGGLKTVADALGKDDKVKQYALSLAGQYAKPVWNGLTTPEKVATVGTGVGMVGIGLGTTLASPGGRSTLSGVDFGVPLGLLPHSPISQLQYDLPKSPSDPFQLRLGVKADELLGLISSDAEGKSNMTLGLNLTFSVSPDGKVTMPYAFANFSPVPGLSLSGGYGVATDFPKLEGPAGGPLAPYKTFPQPAQPAPLGGPAFFVSVDLLKAPFVPKSVRVMLGAEPEERK
jgi:hypothetical protein